MAECHIVCEWIACVAADVAVAMPVSSVGVEGVVLCLQVCLGSVTAAVLRQHWPGLLQSGQGGAGVASAMYGGLMAGTVHQPVTQGKMWWCVDYGVGALSGVHCTKHIQIWHIWMCVTPATSTRLMVPTLLGVRRKTCWARLSRCKGPPTDAMRMSCKLAGPGPD